MAQRKIALSIEEAADYAHSTRDAKRKSVRLLDKVVGND
jgi:hypothetical protein